MGVSAYAEEPAVVAADKTVEPEAAMLFFHGEELFEIGSVADVPAEQNIEMMQRRLKRLAQSPLFRTDNLRVRDDAEMKVALVFSGDDFICTAWEQEAVLFGKPRLELAEERMAAIAGIINKYRRDYDARSLIKGGIFAVVATVVFWVLILLISKVREKEIAFVERHLEGKKLFGLLEGKSLFVFNVMITRLIKVVLLLWLFAIYVNFVLSFFPWTFNVAATLFDWITTPLLLFWNAFVGQLPDFFALAIIVVITRFVLKGFRYVFDQLKEGHLKIAGFYTDWAQPTYRLVRFAVIVFALVASWPYIPGSGSPAFKGISIFMGVLFSLGSTSVMGNIFSGLVITYMRPFTIGDFVEINETLGTVLDRRTFSTRIRTTKNEVVSIPNSAITSNHIMNHSRRVKKDGVLLYSSVTIGYDVPSETVEELLIQSAEETNGLLQEPAPFVLITSLDDFYITHELNAATRTPEKRPRIYSDLHKRILTNFAEAGVEIMSPHYQHNRTGNETTIPAKHALTGEGV
ncbi:MAG: mechanosensitive ion channel family protein [Verrucomicrobia bacterium]|nr:MAG: mechanosensitive ion channel family protein [Verrucomicrobiota bacterium]